MGVLEVLILNLINEYLLPNLWTALYVWQVM